MEKTSEAGEEEQRMQEETEKERKKQQQQQKKQKKRRSHHSSSSSSSPSSSSSADKAKHKGKKRGKKKKGDIKILTLSWNMGNAMADCFDRILPFAGGANDIIALGLQESTYTIKNVSSANLTQSPTDDDCVLQLVAQVKEVLTDEFYMVAHNKRAQMQQLIFARNDLRSRVSKVKLYAENTGFFHIFPNKGGLCVNLTVDSTRLAFISCHLAAHEGVDKCAIRNSSVEEILSSVASLSDTIHHTFFMGDMNYRCTFNPDTPKNTANKSKKAKKNAKEPPAVVMEDDSDEEVDEEEGGDLSEKKKRRQAEMKQLHVLITKEKWPELLALDELNRELAAKRVLCGFKALTPAFPPTFKRIREMGISRHSGDEEGSRSDPLSDVDGNEHNDESNSKPLVNAAEKAAVTVSGGKPTKSREYNLSMTEKGDDSLTKRFYHHKRLPSYTDRILTSSLPAFEPLLEAVSFHSCEDACSSDHKPVIGVFRLTPRAGLKDIMSYSPSMIAQGSLSYNSSVTFVVKELKAKNLTEMDSQLFGGGSDPYCTFSADPEGILVGNVKKMRTRTISHDLNPNWTNDEIKFALATNDVPGLSRNCHFIFSVWDYDVGNPDDLIGSAVVPLASMFEHFEATDASDYPFELELLRDGLPQGHLMGKIEVRGVRDAASAITYTTKKHHRTLHEAIKARNEAAESGKLGCQCTIA